MKTPSRATPTATSGRAGDRNASDPAAVIQMYYTAVNKRDWPTAWRLWGNSPARGAAYRRMISGYRCTVHDWVTEITSNEDSTLVRIGAGERRDRSCRAELLGQLCDPGWADQGGHLAW